MREITRFGHEAMLNLQSPPICSQLWWMGGKDRSLKYEGKFGTALKKYDLIQFELSLNEARRK
jgi:hypothetical protein